MLLHAKIKWLATESLFQLPFISDFLSWNNFAMATKEYMLVSQSGFRFAQGVRGRSDTRCSGVGLLARS